MYTIFVWLFDEMDDVLMNEFLFKDEKQNHPTFFTNPASISCWVRKDVRVHSYPS